MRRRGYTPESIKNFAEKIGVSKATSIVDFELLQFCLREDLNKKTQRVMVVLDPLEVIIENYEDDKIEYLDAENNPEDANAGNRKIPFSKTIYIERDDFQETAPKGWHRFTLGAEVRLKHAYYVKCNKIEKDENGKVTRLICSYDKNSKGGWSNDGRKVKGTSHWVSAKHAINTEIRWYDHLFNTPEPMNVPEGKDYTININKNSLKIYKDCKAEPSLTDAKINQKYQFLRLGYFCVDNDCTNEKLVFNRIVGLKEGYKKT
jgi:glutaminyl-tRNA synthetase